MDEYIVVRTDWETQEMPEKHDEFTIHKSLTGEQLACLRFGHLPEEMEDKWFWYMEGDRLFAHRSWSGCCIYILTFHKDSSKITVTVNRDENQYACTSKREDKAQVESLLEWWTQENYDHYREWLAEVSSAVSGETLAPPEEA